MVEPMSDTHVAASRRLKCTLPPVTAALAAHGITDWITVPQRCNVRPGDEVYIHASTKRVTNSDVPPGWFYDDEHSVPPRVSTTVDCVFVEIPVYFGALLAARPVLDVVPLTDQWAVQLGARSAT